MPVPIRQQALATAQVYLRRFYSKVEIRKTNPYIVITTALYLACKLEECAHHIKNFVNESRALWPCLSISLEKSCKIADSSSLHYGLGDLQSGGVRILLDLRNEFPDDRAPSLPHFAGPAASPQFEPG